VDENLSCNILDGKCWVLRRKTTNCIVIDLLLPFCPWLIFYFTKLSMYGKLFRLSSNFVRHIAPYYIACLIIIDLMGINQSLILPSHHHKNYKLRKSLQNWKL